MTASIVLIGPGGAGKTTLTACLAARLGWTPVELDDLRWGYYREIGYDPIYADRVRDTGGMPALERYWKPFDIHGLERVLADYPHDAVIGLGAGHSFYDDLAQFARAKQALAPFPHVILLLPTPDVDSSVAILRARIAAKEPQLDSTFLDVLDGLNRMFIIHPSNARLATHTLYTHGMTPDEMCDAAEALVRERTS